MEDELYESEKDHGQNWRKWELVETVTQPLWKIQNTCFSRMRRVLMARFAVEIQAKNHFSAF